MKTLFAVLALSVAACAVLLVQAIESTPVLPFYDSADFTPRWARSVDHTIGDFMLVTQTGERLGRRDLDGRVHVASFIYTRCAGICPAMVTQLSKVQEAIAGRGDALLVSYSATPHADTVDTLAAFADERGIAAANWKLVTGDPAQIYALARHSYFADDGRLEVEQPAVEKFLHTEKALLVDRQGRIRGVYNATVPHEMDKLIGDLGLLLSK